MTICTWVISQNLVQFDVICCMDGLKLVNIPRCIVSITESLDLCFPEWWVFRLSEKVWLARIPRVTRNCPQSFSSCTPSAFSSLLRQIFSLLRMILEILTRVFPLCSIWLTIYAAEAKNVFPKSCVPTSKRMSPGWSSCLRSRGITRRWWRTCETLSATRRRRGSAAPW